MLRDGLNLYGVSIVDTVLFLSQTLTAVVIGHLDRQHGQHDFLVCC